MYAFFSGKNMVSEQADEMEAQQEGEGASGPGRREAQEQQKRAGQVRRLGEDGLPAVGPREKQQNKRLQGQWRGRSGW